MSNLEELDAALDAAYAAGLNARGLGRVADYIPELANGDAEAFGIALLPIGAAQPLTRGDADTVFTLQSVSKVFALAAVIDFCGTALFDQHVGVEPSGDAFHSIVLLENERGVARNPLINAGAILVSAHLPGGTVAQKIGALRDWLQGVCPQQRFEVDERVAESELRTGFRNLAIANFLKHWGHLDDPRSAAETYFRQCALRVTATGLSRLGVVLANGGCHPGGERVIQPDSNRTLLALMSTCGLYDEVGRFAVDVGLPAKSGVSGGILAIVPGRMAIATWGPALGAKGNSVAGLAALRVLAERLKLSLFEAAPA
ncbi:MAG: glutaminase A [Pseudomonadota bacterium]